MIHHSWPPAHHMALHSFCLSAYHWLLAAHDMLLANHRRCCRLLPCGIGSQAWPSPGVLLSGRGQAGPQALWPAPSSRGKPWPTFGSRRRLKGSGFEKGGAGAHLFKSMHVACLLLILALSRGQQCMHSMTGVPASVNRGCPRGSSWRWPRCCHSHA